MIATTGRVRQLTVEQVNAKLREQAEARVAYYARHPEEIEGRLRELGQEWDLERVIETEAATTVLTGFILGATVSRKWFVLPVFVSAMLLLHNLHGTYPLLPLLRRLGLRSAREIAEERYALKALRGDFQTVSHANERDRTQAAFDAASPTGTAAQPAVAAAE